MRPDSTSRDDLTATVFRIVSVQEQRETWVCGIIIQEDMPLGCFVRLDPPIAPLRSDHCAAGLKPQITAPDGSRVELTFRIGRVDDDGRIVLFFAEATPDQLSEGSIVRFVEERTVTQAE